jgi:hypothetical protein
VTVSGDERADAGLPSAAAERRLAELAAVLWDERQLLRRLEFFLSVASLIVRAGQLHLLADVDRELLSTSERLKGTEIIRATRSDAVARTCRLPGEATLGDLAAEVDEPWRSILHDHDTALRGLAVTVEEAAVTAEKDLLACDGPAALSQPFASGAE